VTRAIGQTGDNVTVRLREGTIDAGRHRHQAAGETIVTPRHRQERADRPTIPARCWGRRQPQPIPRIHNAAFGALGSRAATGRAQRDRARFGDW